MGYGKDMFDIRVHELLNLGTSDAPAAVFIRTLCDAWVADSIKRAGPKGPRIGTIFLEDDGGGLTLRLVTRLPFPGGLESEDTPLQSRSTPALQLVKDGS